MSAEHTKLPTYYFYERGNKKRLLGILGLREPNKRLLTAEGTEIQPVFLYEEQRGGTEVEFSAVVDQDGNLAVRADWDGRYEVEPINPNNMGHIGNLKDKVKAVPVR